jgi:hypothetical protein
MNDESVIERRPDAAGRNPYTYPSRWGTPPRSAVERRRWVNLHAARDAVELRGEKVAWLLESEDLEWT